MSSENIEISLSAVMDNAADELEVRRVLANADDKVMATWSRYQIASALIRKEVVFPKLDIASSVRDAIAKDEATSLTASPQLVEVSDNKQTQKSNMLLHLGKFAVAASVLAVTLSAVCFLNSSNDMDKQDTFAQTPQATDSVVATADDQWMEQRLPNFVNRHEQQGVLTIDSYDQEADLSAIITD